MDMSGKIELCRALICALVDRDVKVLTEWNLPESCTGFRFNASHEEYDLHSITSYTDIYVRCVLV